MAEMGFTDVRDQQDKSKGKQEAQPQGGGKDVDRSARAQGAELNGKDQQNGPPAQQQSADLDWNTVLVRVIEHERRLGTLFAQRIAQRTDAAETELDKLAAFVYGIPSEEGVDGQAAQRAIGGVQGGLGRTLALIGQARDKGNGLAGNLNQGGANPGMAQDALQSAHDDVRDTVTALGQADNEVTALFRGITDKAVEAAHVAKEVGATLAGRKIILLADGTQAEASREMPPEPKLDLKGAVRQTRKDKTSTATGYLDAANNVLTGLGGATLSILTLVEVVSLSVVAAAWTGAVGGALGILFGAIGVIVGVVAIARGFYKASKIKKLVPQLTDNDVREVAQYAAEQKERKGKGGVVIALAGSLAIAAGIVGIVAIGVASLGVAAVVLGVGAAVIGLGIGIYKWAHKRSKRKRERERMADAVVAKAKEGDGEAVAKLGEHGMTAAQFDGSKAAEKLHDKLAQALADEVMSKREKMAGSALKCLVDGTPSQQYDAELLVEALGLEPQKLRDKVQDGASNEALDRIARKMASW